MDERVIWERRRPWLLILLTLMSLVFLLAARGGGETPMDVAGDTMARTPGPAAPDLPATQ